MQKRETSVRMHQIHTFYALRPKPREPETKIIHTSVQDMVFIHRIVKRTYTFFEISLLGSEVWSFRPMPGRSESVGAITVPLSIPYPSLASTAHEPLNRRRWLRYLPSGK